MNTKRKASKIRSHMTTQARQMAVEADCPFYDGVGEIPESESPYVIVLSKDATIALRVRRTFVEAGVPDDLGALLDEALAGDLEDLEAWDDPAADVTEEAAEDVWDFDPLAEGAVLQIFSIGANNRAASESTDDRQLPSGTEPPQDAAPNESPRRKQSSDQHLSGPTLRSFHQ
jgi:hypothetical protein